MFISAAKAVEPFLRKYHTNKPILPFLATDLHKVLCDLLCRFVKGSVLTPLKAPRMFETFNVKEKTAWLPLDHIDCRFAAKRSLERLLEFKKVSPLARANFLSTSLKLYSTMAHKILERSPLSIRLCGTFKLLILLLPYVIKRLQLNV